MLVTRVSAYIKLLSTVNQKKSWIPLHVNLFKMTSPLTRYCWCVAKIWAGGHTLINLKESGSLMVPGLLMMLALSIFRWSRRTPLGPDIYICPVTHYLAMERSGYVFALRCHLPEVAGRLSVCCQPTNKRGIRTSSAWLLFSQQACCAQWWRVPTSICL